MAVSNNDRISSAGLLDVLKGLQDNGHLGKEPEVTEETTVYERVVVPAPGTYESQSDFVAAWNVTPTEDRLPFKVYTTPIYDTDAPTYPRTVGEPTGDYVEVTKKVDFGGQTFFAEDTFEDISTYTGYLIGLYGGWTTIHFEDGRQDGGLNWVWEMPEKTETKTTKTKHSIKQDYLPNADWSVNDPDAEGYIENRTHWVEIGVTDVEPGIAQGMRTLPELSKPLGYSWSDGEWYPDFEAELLTNTIDGMELTYWVLAVDENGNQIHNYTPEDSTADNFVLCIDYSALGIPCLVFPKHEVETIRVVGEKFHKLDRKYYDYTAPYDDTEIRKNQLPSINASLKDIPLLVNNFPYWRKLFEDLGFVAYYSTTNHLEMSLEKDGQTYSAIVGRTDANSNSVTRETFFVHTDYSGYITFNPTTVVEYGMRVSKVYSPSEDENGILYLNPYEHYVGRVLYIEPTSNNVYYTYGRTSTKVVVGSIDSSLTLTFNDDFKGFMFSKAVKRNPDSWIAYYDGGVHPTKYRVFDKCVTQCTVGNRSSLLSYWYNGVCIKRTVTYRILANTSIAVGSEQTYAKSVWHGTEAFCDYLDDCVGIHYKATSGSYSAELWVDSDYTLHVKNISDSATSPSAVLNASMSFSTARDTTSVLDHMETPTFSSVFV